MNIPQNLHGFQKLAAYLLLSVLTFASPLAWSATAGKVVVAKGSVQATVSGQTRALQRRSLVNERDTVSTGADSRAQLRFVDSALLTLDADSALAIDQYSFTGAGAAKDRVLMRLVRGGFRTVTGAIGKKNHADYKVDTSLASIGIRGTVWSVSQAADGQSVTIVVIDGNLTVTVLKTGEKINIGADEKFAGVIVHADGTYTLIPRDLIDKDKFAPNAQVGDPNTRTPISFGEKPGAGDSSWHIDLQSQ